MKYNNNGRQTFSIFHDTNESDLRKWHTPYAELFTKGVVLDVGCGPGVFLDILRDRNIEAWGIDVDEDVVKQAQQRGHKVFCKSAKELKFAAQDFAGIHISHLIEHLWGEEMLGLMVDSAACLQPNGVLIIRTPNWGNAHVSGGGFWDDYTHKRPYSLRQLVKILNDLGLEVIYKGFEPFGWEDTYIVGKKVMDHKNPSQPKELKWPKYAMPNRRNLTDRLRIKLRDWLHRP